MIVRFLAASGIVLVFAIAAAAHSQEAIDYDENVGVVVGCEFFTRAENGRSSATPQRVRLRAGLLLKDGLATTDPLRVERVDQSGLFGLDALTQITQDNGQIGITFGGGEAGRRTLLLTNREGPAWQAALGDRPFYTGRCMVASGPDGRASMIEFVNERPGRK